MDNNENDPLHAAINAKLGEIATASSPPRHGTKPGRVWGPSRRKSNAWQSTVPSVTRAPCPKTPPSS